MTSNTIERTYETIANAQKLADKFNQFLVFSIVSMFVCHKIKSPFDRGYDSFDLVFYTGKIMADG